MNKAQSFLQRETVLFGFAVAFSITGCAADSQKSSATVGTPTVDGNPTAPVMGGLPGTAPSTATAGTGATTPVMTVPNNMPMTAPGVAGMGAILPGGSAGNAMMGAAGASASSTPTLLDSSGKLIAPAMGKGAQITTSTFDLRPGQEAFTCYHATIPIDGEIDVSYFESTMAPGSHHFILYKNDGDTTPDGTLDTTNGCTLGFNQNWVYSSAVPHYETIMPEGVAMVLGARQKVVFDMHYINTTQDTLHASVTLNVNLATGKFEKAASLVSFNVMINIPANGMQTVGGDCTPGAGSKFFQMLTHTHRRGKLATISRVLANGQMGEELVKTTDWDHPTTNLWGAPDFLTFKSGEKFHYSCTYQNDLDQTVTVGTSAATNEMCMAITYFYPASAGGSCN
jgi:hypothetical protein